MHAQLDHRGVDGRHLVCSERLALGHQHFWVTPEEEGEEQPLTSRDGSYFIAFDGRLDNRKSLFDLLPHRPGPLSGMSDAMLVLSLYQQCGETFFERLLGAFAGVIVDEKRRCLISFCDPAGDWTLFYSVADGAILVGSEESAVRSHPAVSPGLNSSSLVNFLVFDGPLPGETFDQAQAKA